MADDTARRNPGRAGLMAAATAALVLLVTGPASAATVTVASVDFRFQPESQTVSVGDIVRWTFAGEPHTVTSGAPGALDGRFESGFKNPGESFQVTFNDAGTFPYFCKIHPEQMVGTIVVEAAATPAPTATPTARPTVKPTASPTARPTVKPTASQTATATAQPSEAPTPAPSTTSTSAPTPAPSVPPTPSASTASSPSAASVIPSPSPAPSPSPPASTPSSDLDVAPILVVAIVVGLLVAGGVAIARRRTG